MASSPKCVPMGADPHVAGMVPRLPKISNVDVQLHPVQNSGSLTGSQAGHGSPGVHVGVACIRLRYLLLVEGNTGVWMLEINLSWAAWHDTLQLLVVFAGCDSVA